MPTLELVPDGNSIAEWAPFDPNPTGADNYTVIDEGSAGIVETDYVKTTIDAKVDLYRWEDDTGGVLTGATINNVTIYFRAKSQNGSSNEQIKGHTYGGTPAANYYTSDITLTDSWATYNYVWTTNPATSAAWTQSDLNNARMGMTSVIGRGRFNTCFVATVWLVVDYTAGGYGNNVLGVASGDISKINGIASADISKVNGV